MPNATLVCMTFIVLVTGSRDWPKPGLVYAVLDGVRDTEPGAEGMTVVHGACPTGADAAAHAWCRRHPEVREKPYPAKWRLYGLAAGPLRNAQMVNAGADLCLAFNNNHSSGTSGTVDLARAAGIPVVLHECGDDSPTGG